MKMYCLKNSIWLLLFLFSFYPLLLIAKEHHVTAGVDVPQTVINKADPNDHVIFLAGRHHVNLEINKPLTLAGEQGAVLDGGDQGDVIRVRAPDVTIKGLQIENSGHDLTQMNAGIFVEPSAKNILIIKNKFEGNAFGIWLSKSKSPKVLNNRIHGETDRRSQDRGNGIHLSSVSQGLIKGNEVWETRDGIYIENSNNNALEDNVLHDLRYGIHYMYSHSNNVIGNHSYNTRTGFALMQSNRLKVINNISEQDRNYGILMNFITYSKIANNRIIEVQEGAGYVTGGAGILGAEGKAIFIYNSQFNDIHNNLFASCDIGIHLTAGSEDNKIYSNSFSGNRVQVKYVANRSQDWSHSGRGNFWSDYLGWDLNADGIGDKQYEPNDAVDKLLWKHPMARVLMNSPAVQTLRWVQEQFPVLKPQGVRDSAPLMLSPHNKGTGL
jgi:nitrous oxidase accessory protein